MDQLHLQSKSALLEKVYTPNMAPIAPANMGLVRRGTEYAMIVKAPAKIPPAPRPEIALPTMNTLLSGATAQMRDPNSKSDTTVPKSHLRLTFWYILP
jgi:hypothetical protein